MNGTERVNGKLRLEYRFKADNFNIDFKVRNEIFYSRDLGKDEMDKKVHYVIPNFTTSKKFKSK